jgi:cyclic peptide transporter
MIRFLLKTLSGSVWIIAFSSIISVVNAVLGLYIVDRINVYLTDFISTGTVNDVHVFIFLCVFVFVLGFLSYVLFSRVGVRLSYELRKNMVQSISESKLTNIENIGNHKLYATITNDVDAISEAVGFTPALIGNMSVCFFAVAYLCYLSPAMTIVSISPIILGVFIVLILLKKINKCNTLSRTEVDSLHRVYFGIVNGNKELKMNKHLSDYVCGPIFEGANSAVRDASMKIGLYLGFAVSLFGVVFLISIGLIFLFSIISGSVTPDKVIGSVLVILYLKDPIGSLLGMVGPFSRSYIAIKKISHLNLSFSTENIEANNIVISGAPNLVVENVTYIYPKSNLSNEITLGPVNISFKSGYVYFLVGGNGSGKTTLSKLICGLYTPSEGSVYFVGDGQAQDNTINLRRNVSAIFSDFYLFEYVADFSGILQLSDEVDRLLNELGLSEVVSFSSGVFSTTELSQGQRKRLSFICNYMSDSYVYVFDELAADQDPYFKMLFYKKLLPLLKEKNKIVIIISHDEEYFSEADELYKFDNGMWISSPSKVS